MTRIRVGLFVRGFGCACGYSEGLGRIRSGPVKPIDVDIASEIKKRVSPPILLVCLAAAVGVFVLLNLSLASQYMHSLYFFIQAVPLFSFRRKKQPLVQSKRDLFRKGALIGGAGLLGAAAMRGFDMASALPSSTSVGYLNQWQQTSVSAIVFTDGTSYYVKDTGIGSQLGNLIVNANVITAYGGTLGAGTAGNSTTTAGIMEAFNSLSATGGIVAIKKGTYTISTIITPPTSVGIQGEGDGTSTLLGVTIIKQANGVNLAQLINATAPNFRLRDVFLEGNKGNNGGANTIGVLLGASNPAIENVGIQHFHGFGCQVATGGAAGIMKEVYAEFGDTQGFNIIGNGMVFLQCYSYDNGTYGFYINSTASTAARDNTFVGCISDNDVQDGFRFSGGAASVFPINNAFLGCVAKQTSLTAGQNGFNILGSSYNTFIGCVVDNMGQAANNTYSGFVMNDDASANHATFNSFEGCIVRTTAANKLKYGFFEATTTAIGNVYHGPQFNGAFGTAQFSISKLTFIKSETGADANVMTVPTPAATGIYRISVDVDCSVWAANMSVTLSYKDSKGNTVSGKAMILQNLTAGTTVTVIGATGNYSGIFHLSTDNSATSIIVAVTGAVGNTYNISAFCESPPYL